MTVDYSVYSIILVQVFNLTPPGYEEDSEEEESDDGKEDEEAEVKDQRKDDDALEEIAKMVRNTQTAKKRRREGELLAKGNKDDVQEDGKGVEEGEEKEEDENDNDEDLIPQTISKNAFALLGEEDD